MATIAEAGAYVQMRLEFQHYPWTRSLPRGQIDHALLALTVVA